MKVSRNFVLQEFLPPDVFAAYGANSTWFIQQEIIVLAQFIRDYFGKPMIANNWHKGGQFKERGYRTPDSTVGSKLSQHKRGNAIDFHIVGIPLAEVRQRILDDQKTFLAQGLTAIEDSSYTPTWIHVDRRWIMPNPDKILIVRPSVMLINTNEYNPAVDEFYFYENGEMVQQIFDLHTELIGANKDGTKKP